MNLNRKMGFWSKSLLAVLLTLGLAVGCGDDGDGGSESNNPTGGTGTNNPTGGTGGVSQSAMVKDLSAADRTTVCDALEAEALASLTDAEVERLVCGIDSLVTAILTEEGDPEQICNDTYAACVAAGVDRSDLDDGEECVLLDETVHPTCEATVAELEACETARMDVVKSLVPKLDCADIDGFMEFIRADEGLEPPACQTVEAKYPGYLGDDEEDEEA